VRRRYLLTAKGLEEGLGNKNWIAERMNQRPGSGRTYHEGIGIDTALMAINDVIARADARRIQR